MNETSKTPTHMPTTNRPINAGTSVNDHTSRLDAIAKVTGRARFSRDYYLPNSLYACFIRCPYGKAKLTSIDLDAARAVPGVIEAETSREEGRYHGHVVGRVVAESLLAMRRGLAALNAKWELDQVKTGIPADAAKPDITSDAKAMFDGADGVLEAVYTTPVQTHSPLETHGGVIDHRGDEATAYISTQGTSSARDGLEGPLGLPTSKFEVICEFIGGGFGSKLNGAGKEGATAAELSAKYKRPVYLFTNRAEDHLDTGNRPSSRSYVKVAYKKDGTIIGGVLKTWGGVGVSRGGGGVRFPSGRYDLGNMQRNHAEVPFNGGSPRAFRAPGSPQGAFAEELMLDEVATAAGVDPLALRLKLETADDRREMFELGAELIGWNNRKTTGTQKGVIRRGFGLGSTSWGRFPSRSRAEVAIHRDGSVQARSGTQDIGTGQRTVMGIMAADALGIGLEHVSVGIGRSSLPPGPGSGGSVTAHNTAPAMAAAGKAAKEQLLAIVAEKIGAKPDELDIAEGHILHNNEPAMTWQEACRHLPEDPMVATGEWNRRTRGQDNSTGTSNGIQFVELTVDTETGVIRVERVVAVQACGRVVSRKTAESQIIGGVIQGLSYALFEDKMLDPKVGAMVNPNLEWYKILGPADMPHIEPVLWTKDQTGVRSLGEPPTVPTAGAVAGAVLNALGAPVRDLPLTPDRVLAAMEGGAA
jgi:xanthine dehydrogenase YagR molybdenum-binding subunit